MSRLHSAHLLQWILVSGLPVMAVDVGRAADQNAATRRPEIRGVVKEADTNQPVTGADVVAVFLGEKKPSVADGLDHDRTSTRSTTDVAGGFNLPLSQLGFYTIRCSKEGYHSATGSFTQVEVTHDDPVQEVRLLLSLPGVIEGRLVDEETGKGIPHLSVRAWPARTLALLNRGYGSFLGMPRFGSGASVSANKDGRFRLSGLKPGEWVVEVEHPRVLEVRTTPTIPLPEATDGHENGYWPGGSSPDAALPLTVMAGNVTDMGEWRLARVRYFQIHLRLTAADCGPRETLLVYEVFPFGRRQISRSAPCNADSVLSGLPPGPGHLIVFTDAPPERRHTASIPFVITDKNIDIQAVLQAGVRVAGTVEVAAGAKEPDLGAMTVRLDPRDSLPFADLIAPVSAAGTFNMINVPAGRSALSVSGLARGYYVKELRYNGHAAAADTVEVTYSGLSHSLSVVLDDAGGVITGAVREDEKPVAKPFLALVRWPQPRDANAVVPVVADGNDKGDFEFETIPPGEYRILAFPSRSAYDKWDQSTLLRAFSAGQQVDVGARAVVNVTLKLIDRR